jgi:Holliday junction resolvasome RuvABC endonuclease subunit
MTTTDLTPGSVLGLDLSLTGTGLVTLDGATGAVWAAASAGHGLKRDARVRDKVARLLTIAETVVAAVRRAPAPCSVAIEGYAFGAKGAQNDLAELGGVIKTQLWLACRLEPTIYTVSAARKGMFGTGRMEKKAILPHLAAKGVVLADHNQADAWVIAAFHLNQLTHGARDVGDVAFVPLALPEVQ